MTCDIHTWRPIAGECGRYACECGTVGWRNRAGRIVAYRNKPTLRRELTVRDRGVGPDGAVPALPRLDQTEQWTR